VIKIARNLAAVEAGNINNVDAAATLGTNFTAALSADAKSTAGYVLKDLHYYDKDGEYKTLSLTNDAAIEAVNHTGLARFNTHLVRNLFFITNVQRVLRAKLSAELTQSRSVIARSHAAIAPALTEYGVYPFRPDQQENSKDWQDREAFFDK
jgi:hypothetical protein